MVMIGAGKLLVPLPFNLPWLTANEDYSNTGFSGRTDSVRLLEDSETVESFIETELITTRKEFNESI